LLSAADLGRALAAIGVDAPVRFDEVTGSTNATALDLAAGGAPEWTLVAAGHQTEGRGRLGRRWIDRAGGGSLLVSVVLRPAFDPEAAGLLPLLAGAAMAEAASALGPGGPPVRCEWPNDLVRDGGKVGGVLVEAVVEGSAIRHAVVGVGVNLEGPSEEPRARGLGPVDAGALLTAFLQRFAARYRSAPDVFGRAVPDAWRAVSATLGHPVEVERLDGSTARGTAVDVDPRGALVVRTADGDVVVSSGEVRRAGGDRGPAVAGDDGPR